ncbi:uncharacterized protein CDV56_100532 [Aspergillus thermomutatus]|uniref:Uncharacterized protein n=1 Tax=Aspergillus thermomutatus TaxID=41047 RepID=A0A397G5N4_ASPTH|nr:uncharacterized protein CDV56_100532 [Aspergillus thermomutatus]RHZ44666.1 hypothetical protein CDV56_100532 [Aspergillus thermomutatus]
MHWGMSVEEPQILDGTDDNVNVDSIEARSASSDRNPQARRIQASDQPLLAVLQRDIEAKGVLRGVAAADI